jgi:hypothetical protein
VLWVLFSEEADERKRKQKKGGEFEEKGKIEMVLL